MSDETRSIQALDGQVLDDRIHPIVERWIDAVLSPAPITPERAAHGSVRIPRAVSDSRDAVTEVEGQRLRTRSVLDRYFLYRNIQFII